MTFKIIDEVICGDSYSVIKDIPDKSVDCIITDIPYEIDVDHGSGNFGTEKKLH